MSQHNEKNPHQHQSPLHDSSEAKPGMDSLAPEDGSCLLYTSDAADE